MLRRSRLRWFGHLERKNASDWVSACRSIAVVGSRLRGRGKKSWSECVKGDMKIKGLRAEWARDREMWRGLLSGKRLTRASMESWTKNGDDDADDDDDDIYCIYVTVPPRRLACHAV